MNSLPELLTRKEVLNLVGFSRTTLFEMEKAGNFPKARKLHPNGRSVRYVASEVQQWISNISVQ
ncbi:AlpA family phage regulatory protein [Pseudoalteromonas sp. CO325X]|uniref:helix-turn-helix transcriptional regulator n=1 Tax=Pseudoalteromonas sp. CO325X TaxID=1777262 RepID=UPI001022FB57|nr:AlpA family phage regulatory protein [Pseudoalteromonas sp. CO325X]RZF80766.1 AlpA family phage regulatory protein [Pseudoalteromonas sp. CO325X]